MRSTRPTYGPPVLSKLLFRRAGKPVVARVPDGRRIYAVGDVHGRRDLLDDLLQRLDEDDRSRGNPHGELLFLGDLVDRGPGSAGVIERLAALAAARADVRFLMGNHEEILLGALAGEPRALRMFDRFGGRETALSYGIAADEYARTGFDELAALLATAIPVEHRRFLEGLEDMIVTGDFAFVHAGIRPGVALADQRPHDLRWIRDEFLRCKGPLEKVVVHGHTVTDEVVDLPHRVGLDTGAYRTGVLSAMGFQGSTRWTVQVRGAPAA